jgi:hypothetical protein
MILSVVSEDGGPFPRDSPSDRFATTPVGALTTPAPRQRTQHEIWLLKRVAVGAVRSPHTPVSSLSRHVAHVVRVRAKEEVQQVVAGGIVAVMTDEHARRDRPITVLPHEAVQPDRLAITSDLTVASRVATPRPLDAWRTKLAHASTSQIGDR